MRHICGVQKNFEKNSNTLQQRTTEETRNKS